MTLLQINIALMSITVILASLMGGCLLYTLHAVKARLVKAEQKEK